MAKQVIPGLGRRFSTCPDIVKMFISANQKVGEKTAKVRRNVELSGTYHEGESLQFLLQAFV